MYASPRCAERHILWNNLMKVPDLQNISRFLSRHAVEHIYLVCFIRRRLDVHISEKLSHGLLDLLDFDTA